MIHVLTVRQPWAGLIITGQKLIENRTWITRYRGTLHIHSGKTVEPSWDLGLGGKPIPPACDVLGFILGHVQLIDIKPVAELPENTAHAEGPFCWMLSDPVMFTHPIRSRGFNNIWTTTLPDDFISTNS